MKIENGSHQYEIGKQVAETDVYRLYLCKQDDSEHECLLQIAIDVEQNSILDRVAFVLQELKRKAYAVEKEYEKVKTDSKDMLNYDIGFPILVDEFTGGKKQGNRRINILRFKEVKEVNNMIPIRNIIVKDHQRIDSRTSVWIIGKIIKLFVFTHSLGISIGRLDNNNILIEPDQHYVTIFDLSKSVIYSGKVPKEIRIKEIASAAQAVIALLGDNEFIESNAYTDFLNNLANGIQSDAQKCHKQLYDIVDGIWERGFYPFTSFDL